MKQRMPVVKRPMKVIWKHDARMAPVVSVIDRVRMQSPGECCFCGETDHNLALVSVPSKWTGKRPAHMTCIQDFAKHFDEEVRFWWAVSPSERRANAALHGW